MLEHDRLVLQSWDRDAAPSGRRGWSRRVLDGAGAPLGRVRTAARSSNYWLAIFRGRRLEVLETEDDALLAVIAQPWGLLGLWDVFDADERRVGSVYPPALLDTEGRRRGSLQPLGPTLGRVCGPAGETLAEFEPTDAGELRVRFTTDGEANPFDRMLLLGAILLLQPPPDGR